ncbi:alpha/beta hydrolase [Methylopila sp. M107]|uniref:alpha/beta hydrolase n=1 Tax=Methylopila sp. M107 TaxID=1101190 RepID=UPI0003679EC1|nr:alpha/beta hydrolase [Methylopila sp. M107]
MTDYPARARACRTENQFNRLHIDLDSTLAPMEIAAIRKAAETEDLPPASRLWLDNLAALSPTLFEAPEPFVRTELHKHVAIYRGSTKARPRKRLLIAFTGVARRLMVPTHIFLQALDARCWDVVLIRHAGSFLDGARGLADDLDGLLAYVRRETGLWAYRSVAVFGVSSGGGPAVVAAKRLGARRGVSMCGASGERLLATSVRPGWRAALLRRKTGLCFVHGGANDPDREAAVAMASAWGGVVRPVKGVRSHNVMGALMKRGRLKAFLAEVL